MRILSSDGHFYHKFQNGGQYCQFGITEVTAMALISVGVGEATAAIAAPILLGAATGALGSAITGGNPLTGAITGGIGGGFGELGGMLGSALDIGSTAGGALAGAAGGALGAGITGGNPLTSAVMGGLSGGISGYASTSGTPAGGTGTDGTGSTSLNDGTVGPTIQNAGGTASGSVDPNSLAALSASSPLDNSALNGSLSPELGTGAGAGTSAADQSFLNGGNAAAQSSGALGPTVGNAAASTASSAASPDFFDRASNYLFGSGTPAAPQVTLQQALDKQASTGTAQVFNGGVVQANGAVSYSPVAAGAAAKGATSGASGNNGIIGNALGSIANNPLQALSVGLGAYNAYNAPSLPTLQQQQASTQSPGFNGSLPQFQAVQTRNPIADYYTYGYSAQPTQISTSLVPVASGGTSNAPTHLAIGGMPRLPGAPHIGRPRKNSGSGAAMLGALSHLRRQSAGGAGPSPGAGALSAAMPSFARGGGFFHKDGQVQTGSGAGGQKDNVPAMLSEDEFVMPADVVSHLGDGSSAAGGGALTQFVANVRKHKAVRGMPPPARSPAAYMPKRGALSA